MEIIFEERKANRGEKKKRGDKKKEKEPSLKTRWVEKVRTVLRLWLPDLNVMST